MVECRSLGLPSRNFSFSHWTFHVLEHHGSYRSPVRRSPARGLHCREFWRQGKACRISSIDTTIDFRQGYIVFSALNFLSPLAGSLWPPIFQTLHISELTDDFTNTTQVSYPVASNATDLIDQEAESPDIFMRNGKYYVAASNTCGYCNGSIGLLYRSDSIKGPWTRQIIAGFSCDGQVEGVLPLKNPHTGAITDVWHSTSVPGGPRTGFGGHIFQPLTFHADGSVEDLDCSPKAKFDVQFTPGKGAVATGAATSAGDATPPFAVVRTNIAERYS